MAILFVHKDVAAHLYIRQRIKGHVYIKSTCAASGYDIWIYTLLFKQLELTRQPLPRSEGLFTAFLKLRDVHDMARVVLDTGKVKAVIAMHCL